MSLAASTVFLVLVLATVGTNAVTFAAVGGMQMEVDVLTATNVSMYPTSGETAACEDTVDYTTQTDPGPGDESLGMVQAQIQSAEIPNGSQLRLKKDILLPSTMSYGQKAVRIELQNQPIQGESQTRGAELGDLVLDTTSLRAGVLDLSGDVVLDDRNAPNTFADRAIVGTGPPRPNNGEFLLRGNNAELRNVSTTVHLVGFEKLLLPGTRFDLSYVDAGSADTKTTDDCGIHDAGGRLDAYIADYDRGTTDGGSIDVTARVTNPGRPGQDTRTGTVELRVDGTTEDTASVTVGGNQDTVETLTWNVPSGSGGAHSIRLVSSAGVDSVTEWVSVGQGISATVQSVEVAASQDDPASGPTLAAATGGATPAPTGPAALTVAAPDGPSPSPASAADRVEANATPVSVDEILGHHARTRLRSVLDHRVLREHGDVRLRMLAAELGSTSLLSPAVIDDAAARHALDDERLGFTDDALDSELAEIDHMRLGEILRPNRSGATDGRDEASTASDGPVVRVEVENTGRTTATDVVRLVLDGRRTLAERRVTLDGLETERLTFRPSSEALPAGTTPDELSVETSDSSPAVRG